MRSPTFRIIQLAVAFSLAWLNANCLLMASVNLPFYDNFDGDTVGGTDTNFTTSSTDSTETSGNIWEIVSPGIGGAGNGFECTIPDNISEIYNAAVVQAAISGQGFTLSSQFQMQVYSSSKRATVGLVAFANTSSVGQVGNTGDNSGINFIWPFLQLSTTGTGSIGAINFVNFNNGSGNNTSITLGSQVGNNLTINTTDTYTLSLSGIYDGSGDLDLTFSATDVTANASAYITETIPASLMSSTYPGNYFGLVDREDSDGNGSAGPFQTETILQDNFSLVATNNTSTNNFPVAPAAANLTGWNLTFDDEFNGTQLDTTKWNTSYVEYGGNSQRTLPNNDELEVYWDNQFIETNGILRICADKVDSQWYGTTYPYSSGVIDTYGKYGQEYGYFEMRAKLPHGDGLWPAFWMVDDALVYPPEIDILEILESLEDQPHQGAIQASGGGAYFAQFYPVFNSTLAFHVYSLEWSASYLTYYLDGQQIGQTRAPTNPPAVMQVIANLAVGGKGTIPPDLTSVFPAYMDIDYIRIWTRTNGTVPIPYTVGYDIGSVGLAGSTAVNTGGTATISGAGLGYGNGAIADSFQYAAQPVPGDVDYDYLIQVSSMSATNGQAGVMVRQNMDPASQYTAVYLSNGNCIFQSRTNYGGGAVQMASVPGVSTNNLWLRLLRRGNAITAYQSTNGISWVYIAAVTNDMTTATMGTSVFVGAAVSSGSTSNLNSVSLDSLNTPAVDVILDNASSSGVVSTGPWVTASLASGGTAGYYGPSYLGDNKVNKGECSAQFIPTIPNTGYYDIYMRWIASPHNATNTPVTINYSGGTVQVTVNQQHQGGEWVYIGTYSFNAGTGGSVTISNPTSTTGYGVIANAFQFVPGVATAPATPTVPAAPGNLTLTCTPGIAQISLRWNSTTGATSYNVKRATSSGGPFVNIATGVLTSSTYFTDSNVVAGTQYYYVVTALNNISPSNPEGQESAYSNEAGGMASVIVDSADSTGVTIVGSWSSTATPAGYYGATYLEDGSAGGGKSVRFTPTLPVTGSYDVFLNWISSPSCATNVPIDVIYNGQTNTFYVSQQVSDGVWWVYLGTFNFNSGTGSSVRVRDDGASGEVIADAVEFVLDTQKQLQIGQTAGSNQFAIQSIAGSQYQLQRSTTLSPSIWQNVGPAQIGTGGILTFLDPSTNTNNTVFYRVRISP